MEVQDITRIINEWPGSNFLLVLLKVLPLKGMHVHTCTLHQFLQYKVHVWASIGFYANRMGGKMKIPECKSANLIVSEM